MSTSQPTLEDVWRYFPLSPPPLGGSKLRIILLLDLTEVRVAHGHRPAPTPTSHPA